jgi:DNA-binding MarR family transcriptional regulator
VARKENREEASGEQSSRPAQENVEPFQLDQHVFYWMTKVMGIRDRQLAGELRKHDLRVPEWRLIALVRARHSVSIGEAATTTGLDHTTMSRIVDRMVREGKILRLTDATDARVTRLGPTALGEKIFDEVWPIVARLNREALGRLPAGAVPLLCLALSEIAGAMEDAWAGKGAGRRKREEASREE